MKKVSVKAVWDRKGLATQRNGKGYIEIAIYLGSGQRKYLSFGKCTAMEYRRLLNSKELKTELEKYEQIVKMMGTLGEEMTVDNFMSHLEVLGIVSNHRKKNFNNNTEFINENFLEFIRNFMEEEDCSKTTMKHKRCVLRSLERFKRIVYFSDLTTANIVAYDRWLHKGVRKDVTIFQYHKYLRYYINMLLMEERITSNPYKVFKPKRGEINMRIPLTEKELLIIRNAVINREKLARVRDLFIFMAYTGLSYADTQVFDFRTMAEFNEEQGLYFIDGRRVKTGAQFYTPILPPALDVLKRNNFKLLKISNQKANDHLHTIEEMLGIQKPMTCHIARHSFGTLCISHGATMESTSKMMGHTNIKTTQRYAKILQSTVQQQVGKLLNSLQ